MNKDELIYDRRVVERNLREGLISKSDYEKHLKSLPDGKDKALWVPIEELASRAYLRQVLGLDKSAPEESD